MAKEVMRQLPQEQLLYFGDTARAPYGPRPPAQIVTFTRQIVDYLLPWDPKMIVIACNTATAAALEDIRRRVRIPVLGVIEPGARAAIKATRNGHVGVIGTEGTMRSGAYDAALRRTSPGVRVLSLACPEFVPLVEKGLYLEEEAGRVVDAALQPLRQAPIDTLIMGCTHYPFLSGFIERFMGQEIKLISSADQTARDVSTLLYHNGLLASALESPHHRFFCSGNPFTFRQIAENWLNRQVSVAKVSWQSQEEYERCRQFGLHI